MVLQLILVIRMYVSFNRLLIVSVISARWFQDNTALMHAADKGKDTVVDFLLSVSADVNRTDKVRVPSRFCRATSVICCFCSGMPPRCTRPAVVDSFPSQKN
jgi:hypothetical protein